MSWQNIFFFLGLALASGISSISVKLAQRNFVKDNNGAVIFILINALLQLLILFAFPPYGQYQINLKTCIFPCCFAFFSLISQFFLLSAIRIGPTSLTNIINRYNVMIPALVGLWLWRERLSWCQVIGLIFFITCMFLFNENPSDSNTQSRSFSNRWLTMALLTSVSSGIAVIFTKQYMVNAVGPIRTYLILFNSFIVLFSLLILVLRRLQGNRLPLPKARFLGYTFLAALMTDVANYLFMEYITKFSSAFFFPTFSIISLITVLILSVIILKEKIGVKARYSVVLSLTAIYLLSLK